MPGPSSAGAHDSRLKYLNPENGNSMILRNVSKDLPDYNT
jgi:hypothetical protein